MAEYIERGALLEKFQFRLPVDSDISVAIKMCVELGREHILAAPAADVVDVVRCKDCKHGEVDDPDNFPDLHYCHEGCGWNNADFYCKSGERRESK